MQVFRLRDFEPRYPLHTFVNPNIFYEFGHTFLSAAIVAPNMGLSDLIVLCLRLAGATQLTYTNTRPTKAQPPQRKLEICV